MRRSAHLAFFLAVVPAILLPSSVSAQKPPLLSEKDVAALAQELSGETAKRNLEGVVRFHRQRGSQGFHSAAELVAERARAYGLSDVAILAFPSDEESRLWSRRLDASDKNGELRCRAGDLGRRQRERRRYRRSCGRR